MLIFLTLINLLLVIFFILFSVIFFLFVISGFFVDAPFVAVRKKTLPIITEALKLTDNSVLYDVGCGDGRVLFNAINSNKKIKAIGVEKNFIVYLFTKWKLRNSNIKIIFEDIKNISLKDATCIYMYLYSKITNEIFKKINKECSIGTRVVTCDFSLYDLKPDEVIDLPFSKNGLSKRLYVYVLK